MKKNEAASIRNMAFRVLRNTRCKFSPYASNKFTVFCVDRQAKEWTEKSKVTFHSAFAKTPKITERPIFLKPEMIFPVISLLGDVHKIRNIPFLLKCLTQSFLLCLQTLLQLIFRNYVIITVTPK
jgi:hypothetical protein